MWKEETIRFRYPVSWPRYEIHGREYFDKFCNKVSTIGILQLHWPIRWRASVEGVETTMCEGMRVMRANANREIRTQSAIKGRSA